MSRSTKYDKTITIEQRTRVETDIKGWSNTWATLYTSWASVVPLSGAKGVDFSRMGFIESYEVEMRKRDVNVGNNCRIIYNGKTFQITSIKIHDVVNLDIARK